MADFTTAHIQTTVAQPSAPQGYGRAPGAMEAIASLASNFMPTQAQIGANKQAEHDRSVASTTELYSQEALKLADAVDMGDMSSNVARSRMRRLYSTYVANNPMLQDELYQAHNRILTTSGLGKVVAEGTAEEKSEAAFRDKLYQEGHINDKMSPEFQDKAIQNYREMEGQKYILDVETKKLAFANAEIANIRGKLGIQSDRIGIQRSQIGLANDGLDRKMKILGLQQKEAEVKMERAMVGMATGYAPILREKASQIVDDLPDNASPEMRREAENKLHALWAETMGGVVGGLGTGATTQSVEIATKPMKVWYDHALKIARGEQDQASLQTANDIAVQQEVFSSLQTPETLAAAANIKIFGDRVVLGSAYNTAASEAFTNSVMRNTVPPVETPEFGDLAGFTKDTWSRASSGELGEEELQEVQINTSNLLEHIGKATQYSATDLDLAAETFSSDEYAALIKSGNAPLMTSEAAQGAVDVFSQQYSSVVAPLLRERWEQATFQASGKGDTPSAFKAPKKNLDVKEHYKPVYRGAGVKFEATSPSGEGGLGSAQSHSLNTEVAPVLNKLIRLGAHMELHTNYRKYFEDNFEELFKMANEQEG